MTKKQIDRGSDRWMAEMQSGKRVEVLFPYLTPGTASSCSPTSSGVVAAVSSSVSSVLAALNMGSFGSCYIGGFITLQSKIHLYEESGEQHSSFRVTCSLLTFSPSTTSNSTASPSPTLLKYFFGLFLMMAVWEKRRHKSKIHIFNIYKIFPYFYIHIYCQIELWKVLTWKKKTTTKWTDIPDGQTHLPLCHP